MKRLGLVHLPEFSYFSSPSHKITQLTEIWLSHVGDLASFLFFCYWCIFKINPIDTTNKTFLFINFGKVNLVKFVTFFAGMLACFKIPRTE